MSLKIFFHQAYANPFMWLQHLMKPYLVFLLWYLSTTRRDISEEEYLYLNFGFWLEWKQIWPTDVVYRSSTELSIELLSSKVPEVLDGVRPKVQDIVPGERVPFFNHHHLGTKQSQLYGSPKATGTATNDETLWKQTSLDLFEWHGWAFFGQHLQVKAKTHSKHVNFLTNQN